MKKINLFYIAVLVILAGFSDIQAYSAPLAAPEKPSAVKQQQKIDYISVSPLEIVDNPDKYLNKHVTFDAEFIAFSSLGLDYKPAFKDGTKDIGLLIKRENAGNHTIPLSEMKIFLNRDLAEKHVDLEQGDKVKISAKVFSTALSDPWLEVETFSVISQKNKKSDKD